jgi:hypothetical protein
MSTLILSLLLLLLIVIGLMMGSKMAEHFENPQSPEIQAIVVSPALKNMITSSQVPVTTGEQTPLTREQDLQNALNASGPSYLVTPDGTKHMLGPGGVQKHILGPNGEEHWIPNFGPDGPENWPYGPEPNPFDPNPTPRPHPEPKPRPHPGPKPTPHPQPMPPAPGPKPGPKPEPAPMPPPGCPVCPDMSQYIRLDEVPCWNCTLP